MTAIVSGWHPKNRLEASTTLAQMAKNVRAVIGQPLVWETAKRIVAGVAPRDEVSQARAIRSWIAARFRFVKDPRGIELLETPLYLLQRIAVQGYVQGDCDDAATLAAALCTSIGIPAKFVAVDLVGTPQGFDHVFTVAYPVDRVAKKLTAVEFDITRPPDLRRARFKPRHLSVAA